MDVSIPLCIFMKQDHSTFSSPASGRRAKLTLLLKCKAADHGRVHKADHTCDADVNKAGIRIFPTHGKMVSLNSRDNPLSKLASPGIPAASCRECGDNPRTIKEIQKTCIFLDRVSLL